jgi:hypothetical protein
MARKTKQELNKAKAAKQKKIAIGGGVLLVALLAIQVPRTMKMMGGHAKPPVVSTTAADGTTTTTAAPTDPNSLAAPTLAGSPTTTTTAPDTSSLVASVPLKVDQGQLENFQRFVSKDPFAAQVSADGRAAGASGSSGSRSSGSGKSGGSATTGATKTVPVTTTPATPSAPVSQPAAPAAPTTAVISLNGVLMSVGVNTDFPTTAPVFHLVSLSASTAKVAIAGGSYADGSAAITLKLKAPVTLQNTADGTKYTLILEPASTAIASGTSTTPASTTPSSVPAVPSGSGG